MEEQDSSKILLSSSKPFIASSTKWWKLPKTIYAGLAMLLIMSLGSTAYILFAPSNQSGLAKSAPSGQSQSSSAKIIEPTIAFSNSSLTPRPTSTVAPSPTASPNISVPWLTYTNSTYKYSMTYPPDWKATNLGVLEPKVPSYVTFNPGSVASAASNLAVTVSASTRTYDEELLLHSSTRTALTVNGLTGVKTEEKNSAGKISYHVVLKGKTYTYILVGKDSYKAFFNLMYPTFKQL